MHYFYREMDFRETEKPTLIIIDPPFLECEFHNFIFFLMASPRRSLPPGLRPFWAVDNISEATRTFSIETDKYSGHIIGNL